MYKEKWNEVYEMEVENIQDIEGCDEEQAIRELDDILCREPNYIYNIMIDLFSEAYAVC